MSLVRVIGAALVALGVALSARADAPAPRLVAAAGQPAPGGGTFEHFTVEALPVVAPINTRGQVAFFASVLRGRSGEALFLASAGRLTRIAAEGDPAPGGGTLSGFLRHPIPALNDAGVVAFAAAVSGGRTVEGIFLAGQGRLRAIALTGSAAPGVVSGTLAALDAPALNNRGDVVFLASIRRGRETIEAIYLASGRAVRKIVAQGDPAPAGGTFAGFGPPTVNNRGVVAFAAIVDGPAVPGGVFVNESGRTRMLAGAGDETVIGGIFAKFSERLALNDAGTVAFAAMLINAPARHGVFVAESGRPRKVVASGDPAPDAGAFSHFGPWPALAGDGAVAFTASIDHGTAPLGIFVATPAGIARVVAVGDALAEGHRLMSFGLYPIVSVAANGALTFSTAPTATGEGVAAIFTTPPR
ncbi:MAG TPA: choice-of-anchor tandem repeat NxxGxxAF-containing protein [Methylomirabilota bacterium]|jgi:hypothetical protein|nr:choice-of-anchor tandem repeat NxxGxxAF-containing protein [Methylomirabilota bacterium]